MKSNLPELETQPTDRASKFPRLTLMKLLILIAVVACALAFVVQSRRLAITQAALARYEDYRISTSLGVDEFRVIARTLLDADHVKVVQYRIESMGRCNASLHASGDFVDKVLAHDQSTGLYVTEFTIVFDHLETENKLKISNNGYTLIEVPADYSLNDAIEFNDVTGVHAVAKTVDLLTLDGDAYELTLK